MVEYTGDISKELALERIIGYPFKNPTLRSRAITRKAWVNDQSPGTNIIYPGSATLGDAVIGLAVSYHFYCLENTPGQISKEKESRVSRKNHTKIATNAGLKNCLILGGCEGNTKEWDEGDALGECFEEIIGAVYLDDINRQGNGVEVCVQVLMNVHLI